LLSFDEAAFDALDGEVRSVFTASQLLTPDDVQGRYPTLRDAVLHNNWPKLRAARGRILFALDETPEKVAIYRGARFLEGRVMFINTDEQSPAAAYLTLNRPVDDGERIARDVRAGFLSAPAPMKALGRHVAMTLPTVTSRFIPARRLFRPTISGPTRALPVVIPFHYLARGQHVQPYPYGGSVRQHGCRICGQQRLAQSAGGTDSLARSSRNGRNADHHYKVNRAARLSIISI
jgi:hypothetical protein